jgi:hypothetical protein
MMPLIIRSHIAYPPRAQEQEISSDTRPSVRAASIDAMLIRGATTGEIIAAIGTNNEAVQLRRRRLRKKGRIS